MGYSIHEVAIRRTRFRRKIRSLLAALIGEVGGNSTKDRFASVWTSRLCLRSGSSPILPDRYRIWR